MRIFLGTGDIGGQLPILAESFRALGHVAHTGVFPYARYAFDASLQYDIELRINDREQIKKIIAEYDLFVFHFGCSLMNQNRDYPMIRAAGKKIIAMHYGDDVRYWPACEQEQNINYQALTTGAIVVFCAIAVGNYCSILKNRPRECHAKNDIPG